MKQKIGTNRFVFESFKLNKEAKTAEFRYRIYKDGADFSFTETLRFPQNKKWRDVPERILNEMLLTIHLALGVSYWKLYCPTDIQIAGATISKDQANFWNRLYTEGMGEFYYKNRIDFHNLVEFPSKAGVARWPAQVIRTEDKSLLFFGGGKDSWTSAELLNKARKKFTFFAIVAGRSELLKKIMPKGSIIVSREVDPLLLQLSKSAMVYKGHVPISTIWAMIGELAALLYGFKYIIASNERSADYGNVNYLGLAVNHQWSKSLAAEKMLQDYTSEFITPSITYFSLLRPLYEIKIVEIFSRLGRRHFSSFTSCNKNFRMEDKNAKSKWCGHCPKCAFVFLMLAVFLPKKKLVGIFGKNLLDDPSLTSLFRELLGLENLKPFECVGTIDESRYALKKIIDSGDYANDMIVKELSTNQIFKNQKIIKSEDLFKTRKEHLVPKEFLNAIKNT